MFLTLDEICRAWEEAGGHSSRGERIARNSRWLEHYRYLEDRKSGGEPDTDKHAAEVAQALRGQWGDNATVLDIGAGTGRFSLAFAKAGARVTAVDMDEASLTVTERRAARLGLDSVTCVQSMWENYEPGEKFSVVFSSMCPAICNYEELLKMESLAEKACCLITVTRGSYDLHRKRLMELLSISPSGGMTTEAVWYFNALYLMGRQPDVKNYTMRAQYGVPLEDACDRYEIYFKIFGIPPEQSRPALARYFEQEASDGVVHDETLLNTAMITWRV